MKKEWILAGVAVILLLPLIQAAEGFDHVIVNSEKWTDVYSGILYAGYEGVPGEFLVSTAHATVILNGINKNKEIRVLTSEDVPYVFNYPDQIRATGFAGASEIKSGDLNKDLARELSNIKNFIIVSDAFGYNALAVVPYAKLKNAWVFFANKNNIFEIDAILSERNINELLTYGFVDSEVTDTLAKYNPTTINTGDRFQDNIDLVKKYRAENPTKQVILTNGEFIEQEIMAGGSPILFTGKDNVPQVISDYLRDSGIEVGVLIGNDLVGAATNIRQSTGINVMVKFARSARAPTGGVSAVEGLDLYPVPAPNMQLILHAVRYNQASKQLEVTYQSSSNIPVYFKGTITLIESQGNQKRVGDAEPIFIAPGDYKTTTYAVDPTTLDGLSAEIYTLYGETPASLERLITGRVEVTTINVIDACELMLDDIQSVTYEKQKQQIGIKIKNSNDIDCWVDLEIEKLTVGYAQKTLGPEGAVLIPRGKSKTITVDQELTDGDLEKNKKVDLTVYSGEREDSLVHVLQGQFPLSIKTLTALTYVLIVLAIIIIGLIIGIIFLKKKKKDYY